MTSQMFTPVVFARVKKMNKSGRLILSKGGRMYDKYTAFSGPERTKIYLSIAARDFVRIGGSSLHHFMHMYFLTTGLKLEEVIKIRKALDTELIRKKTKKKRNKLYKRRFASTFSCMHLTDYALSIITPDIYTHLTWDSIIRYLILYYVVSEDVSRANSKTMGTFLNKMFEGNISAKSEFGFHCAIISMDIIEILKKYKTCPDFSLESIFRQATYINKRSRVSECLLSRLGHLMPDAKLYDTTPVQEAMKKPVSFCNFTKVVSFTCSGISKKRSFVFTKQ